jgi:hypothetical protein
VFQLGGALDQGLALGEDIAVARLALRVEMAADAVHRIGDVQVEPRRQKAALVAIGGLVERGLAQRIEAVGD